MSPSSFFVFLIFLVFFIFLVLFLVLVLVLVRVLVLVLSLFVCFFPLARRVWEGAAARILLYESPGGNQVDGLPPVFHLTSDARIAEQDCRLALDGYRVYAVRKE